MRKKVWIMAIITVSMCSFCNFALAGDWYDFGRGKINLGNISFIVPKVSLSYHPALKESVKAKLVEGGYANSAQFKKEGGVIGMFRSAAGNQEVLKSLTNESCVAVGFGSWTNSLSDNDIEIVVNSFKPKNLQCYEGVKVSAYIMFDDFKLELYSFSKEKITKGDIKEIEKGLEKALKAYKNID